MRSNKGKSNPNYRHGFAMSPERYAYDSMMKRCYNKKSDHYYRYGARNIVVCERWLGKNGFNNFLLDLGARPSKNHSLGRINNDGNYEPTNCAWQTEDEQRSNRSDTHFIEYNGEKLPAFIWAKRTGIPSYIIRTRITKCGWSVEKALTTPPLAGKYKNVSIKSI